MKRFLLTIVALGISTAFSTVVLTAQDSPQTTKKEGSKKKGKKGNKKKEGETKNEKQ